MSQFDAWLGARKSSRIRLAVMDMWKPFRLATAAHAPQAAILFDKFHVMRHLGGALGMVRQRGYGRLARGGRGHSKGPKKHLAAPPGDVDARWQEGPEGAAGGKQTAQHRLCPQGELRSIVGLRARGLGRAVLRELAFEPQVAAPQAV